MGNAGHEMPITYSIDKEKGIRFHVCTGTVDCDDIMQSLSEVYRDENYDHALHALWDFRDCSGDLSAEAMQEIIAHARKSRSVPGQGRIALVVNRDLEYGLARMYEMLSELELPRQLMVFKDYETALAWIRASR